MKTILIRLRMNKIMKQLTEAWLYGETVYSGEPFRKLMSDKFNVQALHSLESANCISLIRTGSGITGCKKGNEAFLYFLTRQEIWFNRIIGFVAGVLTSVSTAWLISKMGI